MKLTDKACKNLKATAPEPRLSDGGNLYLHALPGGTKSWRFRYRFAGKQKQLVLGTYPDLSLADARKARNQVQSLVDDGQDPAVVRHQEKVTRRAEALDCFELVARAWHREATSNRAPRYAQQILERFERHVFKEFGSIPIKKVTAPMVLDAIRKIEKTGALEMAHRVRIHISDVFVWSISSGLAETDPAALIKKALKPREPELRPAMLTVRNAQRVLRNSESMSGVFWSVRLASRLLALTAARPGVVWMAARSEFEGLDGPEPIWRIPADKMKLTRSQKKDATYEFIVPLSRQAVAVVKVAMLLSHSKTWLFPGMTRADKPISPSTVSKHYREVGFTGKHVPHGWRATFSTVMNERAAMANQKDDREIIDLMLAHVQEGVEIIYNRYLYMPRRRELAQEWADLLMEGFPPPAAIMPEVTAQPSEVQHERPVVRRDRRQR